MKRAGWTIRLTEGAARDFREIHEWTAATFGESQAESYASAVTSTIENLQFGPTGVGVRTRDEIAPGLRSVRVRVGRRPGRHIVFFRVNTDTNVVSVTRILHDAMDVARHLEPEE